MKKVVIKNEKVSVVLSGHPWIFSGAICHIDPIEKGELVELVDTSGRYLATGYANKDQSLCVRILSYEKIAIDDLIRLRLFEAYQLRKESGLLNVTNAYRLVNAEGDRLGGLIVDIYDRCAVIQISTCGMERLRDKIVKELRHLLDLSCVIERSESSSRALEGLEPYVCLIWGALPDRVEIFEDDVKLCVDILGGQKTGFFLDQRPMRMALRDFAYGKKVLNMFSYTGGFSLHALKAKAQSVVSVDVDASALNLLNASIQEGQHTSVCQDAFCYLEKADLSDFDLVILDPPAFAKKQKDIANASKGYKRLMTLALSKMKKGSILYAASCSYFMSEELFEKLLNQAACETSRSLKLIMNQRLALDHPRLLCHKEGSYLKGFVVQVF